MSRSPRLGSSPSTVSRCSRALHGAAREAFWLTTLAALALTVSCGGEPVQPADDRDAQAQQPERQLDAASGVRPDGAGLGTSDARVTTPGRDAAPNDESVADAASETSDYAGPGARAGWKLVFADEFDGQTGALPDATKWVFETGGGGFGNNELQHYTMRPENASLDGAGKLVISARAESYMGSKYTSARLKTAGRFEQAYGRFEARLRIPRGQGIWPAFWMLGANIGPVSWPQCGEIDIMENIGREPTLVHGTLHGPGYAGVESIGKSVELPGKASFADDFHHFAVEWEEGIVRWYLDEKLFQTRTPKDLPAGAAWVYDHPFFMLLNLAVGGQWPGSPDASTKFPQQLTVDYVRVYTR